ncbi:MAG TPA: AbrB/MazE/SpoVT family DNA-binding domain-containing protein [Allosphingosinicella sp.]|nr:AbrB/MazE/SpoVT family DNA-binding domain-containing protein [Allosphingosinicella sp.]
MYIRELNMKVAKWGNSLAIRIPKDVAKALGINEGDDVELEPGRIGVLRLNREMTREEALESLRRLRGTMPVGFKFDREEANAR